MEGASTPSPTDGGGGCGITAAAAEASATDGNPGGRCGWRHRRTSGRGDGNVLTPVIRRTSLPLATHAAGPNYGVSDLVHGDARHLLHGASPLPMCPRGVCGLPMSILDVIFTFLSVEDLRMVLGVCRCLYRAVSESDRTAWKAACFSIWRGKQGFARVIKTWAATEEARRREELEIIAMQQQMLIDAHVNDCSTSTSTSSSSSGGDSKSNNTNMTTATHEWMMLQGGETDRGDGGKHHQEWYPQEPQHPSLPPYWTGRAGKSGPASLATTPSDIDSIVAGARGAPQQLWDRVSLRSTPTYDAIMSTTNSPHLRASLISPMRCSASPISSVEGLTDQNSTLKTKLYWWQMAPERRRQKLYRMQQELHRQRLKAELQNQRRRRREEYGDQLLDEDEEEANAGRAFLAEPNTARQPKVLTGASSLLQSHESGSSNSDQPFSLSLSSAFAVTEAARGLHCTGKSRGGMPLAASADRHMLRHTSQEARREEEEEEEDSEGDTDVSDDGLGDCDNDSEADGKHDGNPYQEFEEEMALTHSLSVLQYAQQRAMRLASNGGKLGRERTEVDSDEEEMRLPVSWKFAYHMSLRDARRQRLTMQELIEAKWYVCFRATGKTHPATFTANRTLIIHSAAYTPNNAGTNTRTGGDVENDAAMPPLLYHLLKGGAELVVHNFPPLKVQRRSAFMTATACNQEGRAHGSMAATAAAPPPSSRRAAAGNAARGEAAAERAFLSEPDATLRRLMTKEETYISPDGEDNGGNRTPAALGLTKGDSPTTDWGWVIQNFFVKIFTVETPVPLYIHRLRRTSAPRPP